MKLNPGEYKCKYCIEGMNVFNNDNVKISFCQHCGGSGKIDWIQNVVGVNEVKLKKWYTCAVGYDGEKLQYYQDGAIVSKSDFISHVELKRKDKPFHISWYIDLKGSIDELKVYNKGGSF